MHNLPLPIKHGVGPSCVSVPPGTLPCILDFLVARFPAIERSIWQQRIEQGDVLTAQGLRVTAEQTCTGLKQLFYYRHVPGEIPLPFKLEVIFQDAHLVVADKPHFMPVTPIGRYVQQSLLVQLKHTLGLPHLCPLHRIDRETAGLVLFGIAPQERHAYHDLFHHRRVHKVYEAIAARPEASRLAPVFPLTHRSLMVEDELFFRMREAKISDAAQYNSETHIEFLEDVFQTEAGAEPALARYRLRPVTGRRHQLRVHMNALGLPLWGDQFYPQVLRGPDETDDFSQTLQLLAKSISFQDPITGALRAFESQLKLQF
ncbi:MAG: pseudouridine synthase [Burkholderiales bacterium]|nr:pseudouridine synthase [Burkholderiales bacterium]